MATTLTQTLRNVGATLMERVRQEKNVAFQRFAGAGALSRASAATMPQRGKPGGYYSRYTDADLRELLLCGDIYKPTLAGGALRDCLWAIGRQCDDELKYPVVAHFNPVPQIVSFYSNSFGGRFGTDITLADQVNDRAVNPTLAKIVRQVWQWSNLDARTGELTTMGSNQGTVGIRIVYKADPVPRVYLDFDDRRFFVRPPDLDARGNVITVYLRYSQVQYLNDSPVVVTVDEIISKYGFSLKYNGEEQLTPDEQENPLGVCPYVLCRHSHIPGQTFGAHAYVGSETPIHAINFALSQLDESTVQHVWPYIFATSPAKAPTKIKTDRYTLLYSQTREGMPQPTFEPMVPDLDTAGVIAFAKERVDWIRERQPQMALTSLSLLSGISGETLAQVLKPAESESIRARVAYEDAVRRALQIAISVGIFNGVPGFNLGTGVGTIDATDRAYGDGDGPEAFEFKPREALPLTVYQQQQQAVAEHAGTNAKIGVAKGLQGLGLPYEEQLAALGKTPEEIKTLVAKKKQSDFADEEDAGNLNQ